MQPKNWKMKRNINSHEARYRGLDLWSGWVVVMFYVTAGHVGQIVDLFRQEAQLLFRNSERKHTNECRSHRLRAAAGQMGALSRIVLLCPLPQILWK